MTLKALADMRADREDMRALIDDIMRGALAPDKGKGGSGASTPPRRSARGAPPPPPPLTAADMRGRVPLGRDAAGNSYHWYDMPYDHDAPVGLMGSRLYVEGPPQQLTLEELQARQQQQLEDGKQPGQQEQQQLELVKQEGDGAAGNAGAAAAVGVASAKPPRPPAR